MTAAAKRLRDLVAICNELRDMRIRLGMIEDAARELLRSAKDDVLREETTARREPQTV